MPLIDKRLTEQTRQALLRLDATAENEQASALEAEIEAIGNKIADARRNERLLSQQVQNYTRAPAGEVADALLADSPVLEAAELGPSKDALVAKREALRSAIGELNLRLQAKRAELKKLRSDMQGKIADALQPLAQGLHEEELKAAEDLAAAFAGIRLLDSVTRRFGAQENVSRAAMQGVIGAFKLLGDRREITIPQDLQNALEPLDDIGRSFPKRVTAKITLR